MQIRSLDVRHSGSDGRLRIGEVAPFTLIRGPNGCGKTRLVDAIVQLLFPESVDRESQKIAEGKIDIEREGHVFTFGSGDSLSSIASISSEDFGNVFVVRDGEILLNNEANYFTDVSERLAGLKKTEVTAVKQLLQREGYLASASSVSGLGDGPESEHMQSRIEHAKDLIQEIEEKIPLFQNSCYDELERRLVVTQERMLIVETELVRLRSADMRGRYRQAWDDLEELKVLNEEINAMGAIDDKQARRWQELQMERQRHRSEIRVVEMQQIRKDKRADALNQEYATAKVKVDEWQQETKALNDALDAPIGEASRLHRRVSATASKGRVWLAGVIAFGAMAALALVAGLLTGSFIPYLCFAPLLIAAVFTGVRFYGVQSLRGEYDVAFWELQKVAKAHDVDIKSMDDVPLRDTRDDSEYKKEQRRLRDAEITRRVVNDELFKLNQKARVHREKLGEIEREVAAIRSTSRLSTLEEYHDALRDLAKKTERREDIKKELTARLGKAAPEKAQEVWEQGIARKLAEVAPEEKGENCDPIRLAMCETEINELCARENELNQLISAGKRDMRDLELKLCGAGIFGDRRIVCRTTNDLTRVADQLAQFVVDVESRRLTVQATLQIFETIERQERARISDLFGKGGAVSKYFSTVTGGDYVSAYFDVEENAISVATRAGGRRAVDDLSAGLKGSLYFCIRLAIAERLIGQRSGFLILDEPFARSDETQLKAQLELLKILASSGWQILYLTSKSDVFSNLVAEIQSGKVDLVKLEPRNDRVAGDLPVSV